MRKGMASFCRLSVDCCAFPWGSRPLAGKDAKMEKPVLMWPPVWCVAVFMLWTLLPIASVCADDEESRIQRGLEIAPVPLNLKGKNRALVGLGSYIVNGGRKRCQEPFLQRPCPHASRRAACIAAPPYARGGTDVDGRATDMVGSPSDRRAT